MAANERWGAFHALFSLAFLALVREEPQRANDLAQHSLTLSLELGDTRGATYALEALGCIAAFEAQGRRAARLFGAAQALREPLGDFQSATLQADRERAGERASAARSVPASTPPAPRDGACRWLRPWPWHARRKPGACPRAA